MQRFAAALVFSMTGASAGKAKVSVQTGASGLPLGLNPVVDKDWDLFAGKVTLGGTYDLADSAFAPKALHVTAKRPGLKAKLAQRPDSPSKLSQHPPIDTFHPIIDMANSKSTKVKSSKQVKTAGKTAAKAKTVSPEPHQLAQDAVDLKAKLDDENLKKKLLKEAMVAIREAIRYREEQEEAGVAPEEAAEAERVAAEEAAEAERLAAEEEQRRLEDAEDAEDDDFGGTRRLPDGGEDSGDGDSICSGDASVSGLDFAAIQRKKLEDAEDAEDEDYDDEGSVDGGDDDAACAGVGGGVRQRRQGRRRRVRPRRRRRRRRVRGLARVRRRVRARLQGRRLEGEPRRSCPAAVRGTVSASFLKYISAGAKALPARPKPRKSRRRRPSRPSRVRGGGRAPGAEGGEDDAPAPPDVVESEEEEVQDLCSESESEEEDARVEVVVVPGVGAGRARP
ncbi:hypothetical protein SO694_00085175 [Aureococcus anophagefferens]|uniref:Uncharacterized protein n=1 Tax=Aureococcus anophagefferens TaxID=44056 RepID=A0ABR1G4K6_AURAN